VSPQDLVRHTEDRLRAWFGSAFAQKKWCLAVSGGLDSMALWRVMGELVPAEQLAVAHVNHGTREACGADERFVAKRAELSGSRFFVTRVEGKDRPEDWLRERRRAFLSRCAKDWDAEAVLTAHHGSDQLETFLMRLLRGSGVDGLGGIRPRNGIFARPFLEVSRPQLDRFALDVALEYREDETNATDRFLRNRVRRRLVPPLRELASEFGGEQAFLGRFVETLEEIQSAADSLAAETDRLFQNLVVPTSLWLRVPSAELLGLSSLWATRLVSRIGRECGASVATRAQRDRVLRAVESGQGKFELVGGVQGEVSCGQVFFFRPGVPLSPPVASRNGQRLRCAPLGWTAHARGDFLEDKVARFFRPGDRYQGKKLKEWWLERRVPAPERPFVPLVARPEGPEVLWVFPEEAHGLVCEAMEFPFSFLSPRRNSLVFPAR
jgi:tRNA(Ile)-lysidine synthetase-like protein